MAEKVRVAACRQERAQVLYGRLLRPRQTRAQPDVSVGTPRPRVDGRLHHGRAQGPGQPATVPAGPDAKELNEAEARTLADVLKLYLELNAHPGNQEGLAPSTFER